MPADLRYGQSIIEAYAQGRLDALQREKLAKEAAQQQIENQQRQQQIDEQTRQFNEKLKQDAAIAKAQSDREMAEFKLKQVLAGPTFQKLVQEGTAPPGTQIAPYYENQVNPETGQVEPVESKQKLRFKLPQAMGGYEGTALTPEAYGKAQLEEKKPLMMFENYLKGILQGNETAGQFELLQSKIKSEREITQMKIDSDERIAQMRLEEAAKRSMIEGKSARQIQFAGTAANAYRAENIVKNFNTVQQGANYALKVDPKSKSGIDDLGLIVAEAKVSDPDSAVKEGEVSLRIKMAQIWADKLGLSWERIYNQPRFLSDTARADLRKAILQRYRAVETQYKNVQDTYKKRFAQFGMDPDEWIPDFSKGAVPELNEIKVRRKTDKKAGFILPEDFDPAKYERMP